MNKAERLAHRTHTIGVIVCERDIDDPFRSTGAIIFEQYTNLDAEQVFEKAQQFAESGRYGNVWFGRIDPTELKRVYATRDLPF